MNFKHQLFIITALIFLQSLFFTSCKGRTVPQKTQFALGTVCTISLFENGTSELYNELFARLELIENEMSSTLNESEIFRLNQASLDAGSKSSYLVDFPLSQDTFTVLKTAIEIAGMTEGAFDPTIGPLVKLWDINSRVNSDLQKPIPSDADISAACVLVDYRNLLLDENKKTVTLLKGGMQIELGGIAKGYAADCLVQILREHNVKRALIDLGGNIYAFGAKSVTDNEPKPWKIGIKNPDGISSEPYAVLACIDCSVVTSGAYERYFEQNGKIYHHILDSKNGNSADSDLLSVTIISQNSMLADSLSTACFVLGSQKSCKLMEMFTSESYVFIKKDGSILTNSHQLLK